MGDKALHLWRKILNLNDFALILTFSSLIFGAGGITAHIFTLNDSSRDAMAEIADLRDQVTLLQNQLTAVSIKEEEHNKAELDKIDALTNLVYQIQANK